MRGGACVLGLDKWGDFSSRFRLGDRVTVQAEKSEPWPSSSGQGRGGSPVTRAEREGVQRSQARDVGLCAGCSGGLGSHRRASVGLSQSPSFMSSCSCWRPLTPDLSPGITRLGLKGDVHYGRHGFWTRLAGLTPCRSR